MAQPAPCRRFKMVTNPNNFLKVWWSYINAEDKEIVITHIDHVPSLMEMDAWPKIILMLTEFWDDKNMVYHFRGFELTPLSKN